MDDNRGGIIRAVEQCLRRNGCSSCENCPYTHVGDGFECREKLRDDIIAMLKAQEPRVMTFTEWIHAPEPSDGECMCYEIKGKGLQSMLVKAFDGTRHLYGKAFRVWTARPTDEQREATKWNE